LFEQLFCFPPIKSISNTQYLCQLHIFHGLEKILTKKLITICNNSREREIGILFSNYNWRGFDLNIGNFLELVFLCIVCGRLVWSDLVMQFFDFFDGFGRNLTIMDFLLFPGNPGKFQCFSMFEKFPLFFEF
jgi:hypothetical protein